MFAFCYLAGRDPLDLPSKNGKRLKRKGSLLKQQIVMIKRGTQSSLISKYSKSVFASLQNILIHLNRNITLLMQFAILGREKLAVDQILQYTIR